MVIGFLLNYVILFENLDEIQELFFYFLMYPSRTIVETNPSRYIEIHLKG